MDMFSFQTGYKCPMCDGSVRTVRNINTVQCIKCGSIFDSKDAVWVGQKEIKERVKKLKEVIE